MKKLFVLVLAAMLVPSVKADERTISVRGSSPTSKGRTEVFVGTTSDSLLVLPGKEMTSIAVTVKSTTGTTISQNIVPANTNTDVSVELPNLPEGVLLEIRDNNGLVYQENNM